MKNKQKEISIIITYIGLILGIGVYFFVTPFAIKVLGESEFGIYNLVYTIVSYFTVLDFGFGNAIIRYTSKYLALKDERKLKEINGLFILIYSLIGFISLIIGIILINNLFKIFPALLENEIILIGKMIKIALVNIVLSFPLSIFLAILKGYEKFILSEIIHVLKLLLSPLSIIFGLFLGYRSVGIITIQTIVNIIISIIPVIYCLTNLKIKFSVPKSKKDLSIVSEIVKFSFYVFLGSIVVKIFWSTDQIILGAFVSSAAVSICSLVSQIVQYYSSLSETITKPYLALITKDITLSGKEKMNFTDTFIKVGRVQFYLLALIISGFVIFGKKFVILWAGESFIEVYYLTIAILIPLTIPAIQNVGVAILQASNIHKFRSVVYFVIAIINILISILLVQEYGIYGTTFGTIIAIILGHVIVMNIYYSKKLGLNLKKFWKSIILIVIKLIPLFTLGYFINAQIKSISWLTLGVEILIYTLLYIITLYLFVISNDEKSKIINFIERKKENEGK